MPRTSRIGVIYPSNGSYEREFEAYAPPDVSFHFTRWKFPDGDWFRNDPVERMAGLADDPAIPTCAALFEQIAPAVVTLACTSASFACGADGDIRVLDAMRRGTTAPVSTTSTGFLAACRTLGVRRVAIASIYLEPLTRQFMTLLAGEGIETINHSSAGWAGLPDPDKGLGTSEVMAMVRGVNRPSADAVLLPETDLLTSAAIPLLEAELGKPVIGAIQATVWHAARLAGHGWDRGIGRLWSAQLS